MIRLNLEDPNNQQPGNRLLDVSNAPKEHQISFMHNQEFQGNVTFELPSEQVKPDPKSMVKHSTVPWQLHM